MYFILDVMLLIFLQDIGFFCFFEIQSTFH
jgi:hypothetical protein